MALPVNVDSTYADSGTDASVALHQQHHDTIHAAVNTLDATTIRHRAAPTNAYETIPRYSPGAVFTLTNTITRGRENFCPILLPAGLVCTHITFVSGTTALGTPTNWWFGLYNSSFGMLALTADQTTTAWATFTSKTLAIATTAAGASSSFTTTYTGIYYLSLMVAAASGPTLFGSTLDSTIGAAAPTLYAGTNATSGLTTPPGFPRTAATPGTGGTFAYAFVTGT